MQPVLSIEAIVLKSADGEECKAELETRSLRVILSVLNTLEKQLAILFGWSNPM